MKKRPEDMDHFGDAAGYYKAFSGAEQDVPAFLRPEKFRIVVSRTGNSTLSTIVEDVTKERALVRAGAKLSGMGYDLSAVTLVICEKMKPKTIIATHKLLSSTPWVPKETKKEDRT